MRICTLVCEHHAAATATQSGPRGLARDVGNRGTPHGERHCSARAAAAATAASGGRDKRYERRRRGGHWFGVAPRGCSQRPLRRRPRRRASACARALVEEDRRRIPAARARQRRERAVSPSAQACADGIAGKRAVGARRGHAGEKGARRRACCSGSRGLMTDGSGATSPEVSESTNCEAMRCSHLWRSKEGWR